MRRGDGDEHDLRLRREHADAVDDPRGADREAPDRLVDHRLDRRLGHAGIVLELERADLGAVVAVAHRADEGADRADAAIAGAQRRELGAEVEVLGAGS